MKFWWFFGYYLVLIGGLVLTLLNPLAKQNLFQCETINKAIIPLLLCPFRHGLWPCHLPQSGKERSPNPNRDAKK
jgi:hypothetical protein